MADATKIIIKQEYFDNIKVAIDSLNTFFGSNFKTKNFPMLDSNDQLDGTMMSILSWMNNVDPSLVENAEQMNQVIDKINDMNESADGDLLTKLTNDNDERGLDMINAVIGHKMLQYIADHFESFSKLMNGIYTFELFTKPKEYESVINVFSKPIPMDEIEDALGDNKYQILNEEKYIHGVFENPQITLPKSMKEENEVSRFDHGTDLENVEVLVDDTVQEAAEINYFVEMKPEHLRYHPALKCVQISKQFEAKVNQLVSGLRGCNTTEDLKQYFNNFPFSPDDFSHVVIPCILARVFASTRKFPNQSYDKAALKKYTDSYKSILSQNKGANRFAAYDLFSTFRADKEGTIKFIEDFMKLRLVNDESGAISNNTLLTLFNIFDSRIYLDIMYNMLPDNVKNSVAPSEDAFVKHVRAKINKNSRNGNIYKKDTSVPSDSTVKTSEEVVEYVSDQFNDVTLTMEDMRYCENYQSLVYDEINTIGDALYNEGVSPEELVDYIGESFTLFDPPKTYQEGLFTKIKDHFAQKKLKKIHDLETSIGVTFSPEYIDVLMGKLKLREYMTSDLEICVIFQKLNGATKTGIKKGMVDLQRYDVDKGVDKSKLYPIGRLMFSQRLPMYELPIIASDTEGNVYVTCDKSNINKLVKFSSSIKEFVRNIHRQAFEVESREYMLSNCYNLNGNAYDVEVRLQAKYLYPEALLYETYYCKNNGESFRWLLDYAVYPALDEYFGKKFGVEKTSKTMYDENGNPVTITTGGFDSTKALACIQRILIADDYNHQHFKLFFAFVFDKHDKPAVMVELDGEDIVRIEMMQGMPNQNHITSRMPRDMKSLSGFDAKNALSIDKSIQNDTKKYDEPVQESDEIDVDHDFMMEAADVDGSIPDYMKTRIDLSDGDENSEPKEPVVTDVQLPPDIPANDFDDLGNSIDERLDTETDKLDQVLGSGYQGEISKQGGEGKVVYNITYNYNNSYNTSNSNNTSNSHNTTQTNSHNTTNDSSSNKQVTSNSNNSTSKKVVTNSHNVSPTRHRGSNNNNNSTVLSDTKDSNATDTSKKDTFSTGKSIQEVFAFLESEEPLSDTMNAKPPKEDLLTKAMDNDRKTLSKQQSLKKGLQKIGNTARAVVKPIGRTKQWLTNMVNSLIKRDEDKVKASLIENPSYRSAVFKAGRIALKLGLFATFAYIEPWLGVIYAGAEGLKLADRNRLRKEVQDEFATELKIMDEKIEQAKHELAYGNNDPKKKQELYKLMRQRDKMQQMAPQSMKSYIKRAADF